MKSPFHHLLGFGVWDAAQVPQAMVLSGLALELGAGRLSSAEMLKPQAVRWMGYPLVMTNILYWPWPFNAIHSGFSHWTWWLSMAMLNYQRIEKSWNVLSVFHWTACGFLRGNGRVRADKPNISSRSAAGVESARPNFGYNSEQLLKKSNCSSVMKVSSLSRPFVAHQKNL